jgi:hypothetical protein
MSKSYSASDEAVTAIASGLKALKPRWKVFRLVMGGVHELDLILAGPRHHVISANLAALSPVAKPPRRLSTTRFSCM